MKPSKSITEFMEHFQTKEDKLAYIAGMLESIAKVKVAQKSKDGYYWQEILEATQLALQFPSPQK
jgi:hypothetical protein